jgi:ribosomal protein S27E
MAKRRLDDLYHRCCDESPLSGFRDRKTCLHIKIIYKHRNSEISCPF